MTDAFRAAASRQLELNELANKNRQRKPGEVGYLIGSRAELARAVDTDVTMINKIIGPKRATSKVHLVQRSAFVARVRAALDLQEVTEIIVPADRAALLRRIAALPADMLAVLASSLPPIAKK